MLRNGFEFGPVVDRIQGVFCWIRFSDQETTLWDTGQDALQLMEYCRNASPAEIDETARLAFDAMGSS